MIIILKSRFAPAAPEIIAKVVMIPSMPPKTPSPKYIFFNAKNNLPIQSS
jgi:hypothetical protein